MADEEKPRSIRFPQSLWDAIDRDALRCKRSAVKQMEAVLSAYYQHANVDLSTAGLGKTASEFGQPPPPLIEYLEGTFVEVTDAQLLGKEPPPPQAAGQQQHAKKPTRRKRAI